MSLALFSSDFAIDNPKVVRVWIGLELDHGSHEMIRRLTRDNGPVSYIKTDHVRDVVYELQSKKEPPTLLTAASFATLIESDEDARESIKDQFAHFRRKPTASNPASKPKAAKPKTVTLVFDSLDKFNEFDVFPRNNRCLNGIVLCINYVAIKVSDDDLRSFLADAKAHPGQMPTKPGSDTTQYQAEIAVRWQCTEEYTSRADVLDELDKYQDVPVYYLVGPVPTTDSGSAVPIQVRGCDAPEGHVYISVGADKGG